jgi:hypothetical protein
MKNPRVGHVSETHEGDQILWPMASRLATWFRRWEALPMLFRLGLRSRLGTHEMGKKQGDLGLDLLLHAWCFLLKHSKGFKGVHFKQIDV